MTHNATMDLAEKMGSEATEADAQRMAVILEQLGYDATDTAEIPEEAWLAMVSATQRTGIEMIQMASSGEAYVVDWASLLVGGPITQTEIKGPALVNYETPDEIAVTDLSALLAGRVLRSEQGYRAAYFITADRQGEVRLTDERAIGCSDADLINIGQHEAVAAGLDLTAGEIVVGPWRE